MRDQHRVCRLWTGAVRLTQNRLFSNGWERTEDTETRMGTNRLAAPAIGGMAWPRRRVLKAISTVGVGSVVLGRALTALAQEKNEITEQMIQEAEWVSEIGRAAGRG